MNISTCPHCGGAASASTFRRLYWGMNKFICEVECKGCNAMMRSSMCETELEAETEAIQNWNKRVG